MTDARQIVPCMKPESGSTDPVKVGRSKIISDPYHPMESSRLLLRKGGHRQLRYSTHGDIS